MEPETKRVRRCTREEASGHPPVQASEAAPPSRFAPPFRASLRLFALRWPTALRSAFALRWPTALRSAFALRWPTPGLRPPRARRSSLHRARAHPSLRGRARPSLRTVREQRVNMRLGRGDRVAPAPFLVDCRSGLCIRGLFGLFTLGCPCRTFWLTRASALRVRNEPATLCRALAGRAAEIRA